MKTVFVLTLSDLIGVGLTLVFLGILALVLGRAVWGNWQAARRKRRRGV